MTQLGKQTQNLPFDFWFCDFSPSMFDLFIFKGKAHSIESELHAVRRRRGKRMNLSLSSTVPPQLANAL